MENSMQNERGQTIVLVAFLIVILLLALGIAIDGGMMIVERRRMQGAADAGSLAGAHRLISTVCDSESSDTADAAIWAEVVEYARRNGVQETNRISGHYVKFDGNTVVDYVPQVMVGDGVVPTGAIGVAVNVGIERQTFFMGFIGIDRGGAQAEATAVTGPPLTGGGLRPYGVPEGLFTGADPVSVGDCFTVCMKNCNDDADWANSCYIKKEGGDGQLHQHRGWLNLSFVWNCTEASSFPRAVDSGNIGASTIREWMANGWDGTLYADCYWNQGCGCGDFIHAKPGTNSTVFGAVPIGVDYVIPIFDYNPQNDEILSAKPEDVPQQGAEYFYHVVGFATVQVPNSSYVSQGAGTITSCLQEVVWGEGQPSPNSGYGSDVCKAGTMVVALWE